MSKFSNHLAIKLQMLLLASVQQSQPFKPLSRETFFEVPVVVPLDAAGSVEAVYSLNGDPLRDPVQMSSDVSLVPVTVPKAIDAHLQAKTDAALREAEGIELKIRAAEQKYGADSANLCPKLCSVAVLYRAAGEYQLAEDRLNRALKLAQTVKAVSSQAKALSELGQLSYALGKNDDAATRLKSSVDLYQSIDVKNNADYRATLEEYAKVLYKLNRTSEGDTIYKTLKSLPK